MSARRNLGRPCTAWVAVLASALAAAGEEPFAVQLLHTGDRVVQADLSDLDGDGRGDLLCIGSRGLPPDERREIHAFFQRPDGSLPDTPDWSGPLPAGVAAYDLAPLDAVAGTELILLQRRGVTLLSLAGRVPTLRELQVGPEPTLAVVGDERGVDRLTIAIHGLADAPRLLVPGLGTSWLLSASGELLGSLEVGARANYFLPPRTGPLFSENEAEVYLDHPRVSIGDVDGDGRGDVVSSNRHELRVFLQGADGRFPSRASRSLALGRIRAEDHVRNAGSVRVQGADFDGDERLDLLIASASGGVFGAETDVTIHLNENGHWKLDAPDQSFHRKGGLSANQVIDLDGDGRLELVDLRVPTGVLEIVEVLVTRAIDAEVSIFRREAGRTFESKPWHRWKIGVPWSLSTFRTLGFVPTLTADVNGDGTRDFLASGDGERLEIHLGDPETGYATRHASQELDTSGRIRFGDLDADGLDDFVLYSPRRPDAPVRVGRNRGLLPATK